MNLISTSIYLFIGIAWSAIIDIAFMYRDKGHANYKDLDGNHTNWTRFLVVLIWPVFVTLSIIYIIRDKNKKKN